MRRPNNLEHEEAEAFAHFMRDVARTYYKGPASAKTAATINKKGDLCMVVIMRPIEPGDGPKLCLTVQMAYGLEDNDASESWKSP